MAAEGRGRPNRLDNGWIGWQVLRLFTYSAAADPATSPPEKHEALR